MKKVLILSQNDYELSTELVIDWIDSLGGISERVNGSDALDQLNFTYYPNFNKRWNFIRTPINELHSIWFRRWDVGRKTIFNLGKKIDSFINLNGNFRKYSSIVNNIETEYGSISSFFLFELSRLKVKYLTRPGQSSVNKLIVLQIAKEIGLQTPEFALVSSKSELQKYIKKWGKVISKDINVPPNLTSDIESFNMSAQLVGDENIELLPDNFDVSIIQKYIEKDYELRAFYLNGEFYTMAIFSQSDDKTKVDFRNYNESKPNRNVPFKLANDLTLKLQNLMKALNLETGSIDIIKSGEEYYFLEVNPVGQFAMVSSPCNYNLEKKVAEYLLN